MRKIGVLACASLVFVFARSPEERTITDPASVTSPRNANAAPVPIDDLFFSRSVNGASWSPDGKQIVFGTNTTGRINLWKVSSTGGWPVQLAVADDRQVSPVWSPDGKWIIWQQDRGGNEAYDLFAIPSAGGTPLNLTNTPNVSESSALFSPDSKWLAIDYKPTALPQTDVAVLDLTTKSVRNLTNEKSADRSWTPVAWSRDGSSLYANRGNSGGTIGEVYRIDVATGRAENLTPNPKPVRISASGLSPDGKTLLVTTNASGYDNVALLDVASKTITSVTAVKWEANSGDFSPDGKSLTYTINEDGRTDVYLAHANGSDAQKLAVPEGLNGTPGSPSAFSPAGDRLLISHQSATMPGDLWIYDLSASRAVQLSHSAIASIGSAALPASQIVHYESFDSAMISALLWVPFNIERNGKNPGIVLPHGGPTGQTVDSFSRNVIALVSRGYTVIAPNVRGSTGYGDTFQHMNHQDLGGGDLQDEVYAAKFLAATGYVDSKRIGITGGSYGGYMTLMAIGKTPDVWAAGVEQYGIVDWFTMLQHEDPRLQEYEKSLLGDPVKDRTVYENASPIKYLRNATAPLLVLQGENDIRVPKEEAEQVVSILKGANKTVDVHIYPAEGHGFAKRENQIDAIKRTIDWFDRYLKGNAVSAPAAAQASDATWHFVVGGDSRNCGDVIMPAIAAAAIKNGAKFYWHLGDWRAIYKFDEDMVQAGLMAGKPLQIQNYLKGAFKDAIDNQIKPFGGDQSVPVFVGIGNHETIWPMSRARFKKAFAEYLDAPAIREQRLRDDPKDTAFRTYFHVVMGGIDFITLDNGSCDMFDDEQMTWLRNLLARDAADVSIHTIIAGMHAALPDSRSCGHSMGNYPAQQITGREVYKLLLGLQNDKHKQVYVLSSHSHFVMDNVYDSEYWRANGGVLPGWIVGTSGAIRYRLPETATPGPNTRTDVYGYLWATVHADGSIAFEFHELTPDDIPKAVKDKYSQNFVETFCFAANRDIGPQDGFCPKMFDCKPDD